MAAVATPRPNAGTIKKFLGIVLAAGLPHKFFQMVIDDLTFRTDFVKWVIGRLAGESLPENEYLVHVDYDMPQDKEKLESEFSKDGVSGLLYGGYEWQLHSSCANIDQTPGGRVFLVKHFGRKTESEANINEMDKLGYRPGTHLEAYAFAKANPELQRQSWIVALGSSAMGGDGRYVAVLVGNSGRRILLDFWFDSYWNSNDRFLFVRKSAKADK